jgi:hypothetical protein
MNILLVYVILNFQLQTTTTVERVMPNLEACKTLLHTVMATKTPDHIAIATGRCEVSGSI